MATKGFEQNKQISCIEGTCLDFCPQEEVNLRVKENMVHKLEATNTGIKLIKSYSRSAADANMALPHLLRPFPVLLNTVEYLMLEIANRVDAKKWVVYDFIDDRLRAVRQDMTIQRLPPEQCTKLLEPMIRFYVYYAYRLCECNPNQFDPVLNKKYTLECLKWFLSCYNTIDRTTEWSPTEIIACKMKQTDIGIQKLAVDRVLVESLYILCNLSDTHPLYRYLQLPTVLKSVSALKTAYNIGVANYKGEFVRIMKLSKQLCPLTFAALFLYLPILQKNALKAMSHAYNNRHLTVPLDKVKSWLLFASIEEAADVCTHYGLDVKNGVNFNKAAFKDVEVPKSKRNYLAKMLQLKLEDVMSYTL